MQFISLLREKENNIRLKRGRKHIDANDSVACWKYAGKGQKLSECHLLAAAGLADT